MLAAVFDGWEDRNELRWSWGDAVGPGAGSGGASGANRGFVSEGPTRQSPHHDWIASYARFCNRPVVRHTQGEHRGTTR